MKADMQQQIAEYGRQLRAERDPLDMAAVLERGERVRPIDTVTPPVPANHAGRWWRIVGVAVAAAAVVLVLVGVPLLLRGDPVPSPPATESTVTTTAVTPDTSVPEAPPTTVAAPPAVDPSTPPRVVWQQVTFGAGEGPSSFAQVRATPNGFAAFDPGYEEWDGSAYVDVDGDTRHIMWTSPDGMQWEPTVLTVPGDDVPDRPAFGGVVGDYYIMHFWGGTGGSECVICISTDLVNWQPFIIDGYNPGVSNPLIVDETVVFGGGREVFVTDSEFTSVEVVEPFSYRDDVTVENIVATADRFYATTYAYTPVEAGGPPEGPECRVWSSIDGTNWDPDLTYPCSTFAPVIAANEASVLVHDFYENRLWRPEFGGSFEQIQRTDIPVGEVQLTAIDGGFLATAILETQLLPGPVTPPFVTADGSRWERAEGIDRPPLAWTSSGSIVIGLNGLFECEIDEEATEILGSPAPSSCGFEQSGSWTIGRVLPSD